MPRSSDEGGVHEHCSPHSYDVETLTSTHLNLVISRVSAGRHQSQILKTGGPTCSGAVSSITWSLIWRSRIFPPTHCAILHSISVCTIWTSQNIGLHFESTAQNAFVRRYLHGEYAARFRRSTEVRSLQQPIKTHKTNISSVDWMSNLIFSPSNHSLYSCVVKRFTSQPY